MNPLLLFVLFVGAIFGVSKLSTKRLTVSRAETETGPLPEPVAREVERRSPTVKRLRFVIAMRLSGIEGAFVSDRMLYDKTASAARTSLANVRRECPGDVPRLVSDTPVVRVIRGAPGFVATVEWKTRAVQITNRFRTCVERALRRGTDGDRIQRITISLV